MSKVVVNMSLTLDGVMQAPGRPDEDTRGGFKHGGWALPYFDPVMSQVAAEGMARMPALLLGRRTYEDFYAVWPNRTDNPFTEVLNNARKYVASTTLKEPLLWVNSTLLKGDAAAAVATLKEQSGQDFTILGSGVFVQSLMRHNLVDEYVLSIHPLVLGSGRRLFPDGSPFTAFRLVDSKTTTTGVVIATYRLAGPGGGEGPLKPDAAKIHGSLEMDTTFRAAIGSQFGAAIDMLDNALRACPDELWRVRLWNDESMPPAFSEFWYVVYHTLFWLDLYLSGSIDGFTPPAPFTLDELDPAGLLPDRVYTKAELQTYLDHSRQKCQATIEALTDERANQRCKFAWVEMSFAELLLDNMRHVQEHTAQLNLILGQKIASNPRWIAMDEEHIRQRVSASLARTRLTQETIAARRLITMAGKSIDIPDSIEAPTDQGFEFEVVTVNDHGEITERQTHTARQFIENLGGGVSLEMVVIPEGMFLMGSRAGQGYDDERPQHSVRVSSFLMGKYPVTQEQWEVVMGWIPPYRCKGARRPVDRVSWDDARAFCERLSERTGRVYRLPGEAEWEYACRAQTTTPFYFGETITTDLANYVGEHIYRLEPKGIYRHATTDVGSFPPNALGLHDMHGNVWEWCADAWHDNYAGAPVDGSVWESKAGAPRVLRGGGWHDPPDLCRSAARLKHAQHEGEDFFGFRVALASLEQNSAGARSPDRAHADQRSHLTGLIARRIRAWFGR